MGDSCFNGGMKEITKLIGLQTNQYVWPPTCACPGLRGGIQKITNPFFLSISAHRCVRLYVLQYVPKQQKHNRRITHAYHVVA